MLLLLRFNIISDWNLYKPYILCSFVGNVDDRFSYVVVIDCFIWPVSVGIVVGVWGVWDMWGLLRLL